MKFASKKTPFLLLISLFLMMIFTFTTSQARYHSTEIYVMRYCDTNDHKGHKGAKKLGYYLSRQNIPVLYASPDSKVRDTAQIIARETDSDIKYDRQFAEHATKQRYKKPSHKPKDLLKRFLQDELGGRDDSRNNGEYKKYGGIMNAIRHYSKRSDSLYIVSHRGVIQSMLDIADHSRSQGDIRHCSIYEFDYYPNDERLVFVGHRNFR